MNRVVPAAALLALVTACKSQATQSDQQQHTESTVPGPERELRFPQINYVYAIDR